MNFIKYFGQVSIADILMAGGKGASLEKLTKEGFCVPEGFIILTSAFDHFLAACSLDNLLDEMKKKLSMKQWEMAASIAEEIHEQILSEALPPLLEKNIYSHYSKLSMHYVSIRSSAVEEDQAHAAWAGVLSTFLNTRREDLLVNIKRCWASLFSREVVHYLKIKSNTLPDLSMAVIVQKMVNSEVSGVAFSINPVNSQKNQIIIEAASGLGEAMVSGSVTPDNYIVAKDTLKIIDQSVPSIKKDEQNISSLDKNNDEAQMAHPKLNELQIIDLARNVSAIESKYGVPVDIEWAWADKKFYILQSRPISNLDLLTLDNAPTIVDPESNKMNHYEFWWSDREPLWAIDCRLYILSEYRTIIWNQIDDVLAYTIKGNSSVYISTQDVESAKERGHVYLQSDYSPVLEKINDECMGRHQKMYSQLKKTSFSKQANEQMLQLFKQVLDTFSLTTSYYKASGPLATNLLMEALAQHFSQEELAILSLNPKLDIINLEQLDWMELLQHPFSRERLLEHVEKYPWIVQNHYTFDMIMETLGQRFNEGESRSSRHVILAAKKDLKEKQEAILEGKEKYFYLINNLQAVSAFRTKLKSYWSGMDYYLMPFFEEITRRTGECIEDLNQYYLIEDIIKIIKSNDRLYDKDKEIRKGGMLGLCLKGKVIYYYGADAEKQYRRRIGLVDDASKIKGTVANRGNINLVNGQARILECNNIVQNRNLKKEFQQGDIIITSMVQLNMWDILNLAGAIVTDEGGMLSHAAILAREANIPCIVGTHSATSLIKDKDLITINTTDGTITVDEK